MNALWISLFAIIATVSAAIPNRNRLEQIRELPKQSLTEHTFGTVGAKETYIEAYPFTVSITLDTDQSLIGGGAVVNKNWIVTSAYPLAKYLSQAANISIRAGSDKADQGGQQLNLSQIIIHEKFGFNYWYNIALIKTTTDIQFDNQTIPVTLASSLPRPGTRVQIVGFGGKTTKSKADGHIQVATVRVQSLDRCQSVHGYIGTTGQCADARGIGPCYGDFGNPLVYKNELLGFYLGGDICNFYDLPEIYSNVPTLKSWIENRTKSRSTAD